MNVSVTRQQEAFIRSIVKSGRYQSVSEVVRDALRLLQDHDRLRELKLAELRRDIEVGIKQADRGELIEGKQAFRGLRRKIRTRAKKGA
jgi:antitoxin ParD1/3/4